MIRKFWLLQSELIAVVRKVIYPLALLNTGNVAEGDGKVVRFY
ncbi:hypothetical protein [Thiospirillum jenense]|nr:hypothetical protein [Thiospirillum jenense]